MSRATWSTKHLPNRSSPNQPDVNPQELRLSFGFNGNNAYLTSILPYFDTFSTLWILGSFTLIQLGLVLCPTIFFALTQLGCFLVSFVNYLTHDDVLILGDSSSPSFTPMQLVPAEFTIDLMWFRALVYLERALTSLESNCYLDHTLRARSHLSYCALTGPRSSLNVRVGLLASQPSLELQVIEPSLARHISRAPGSIRSLTSPDFNVLVLTLLFRLESLPNEINPPATRI
ncbi:hypothetical protein DFH06DRAFT_1299003 [Mycena polygramma]|nr:hypothetical protein DFH06DRAFT_1299003 [Mycena polygramma]